MKNTVTITLESEKLSALKSYLEQKNSSLDAELSKYCEQLYIKVVPQSVREYISMMAKQQTAVKPKRTSEKPTNLP